MTTRTANSHPARRTQGSHWVRPSTRLAIHMRDGLACCWCGHAVEEGERLTLDHLRPYSRGGSNAPANLVTSCAHCNSARGTRSVAAFARAVAEYTQQNAGEIVARIRRHARRALPRAEALAMIAARD